VWRRTLRDLPAVGVEQAKQREDRLARELVHGTCVALGDYATLLRGGSGSGKSDLALRFLELPADGTLRSRLVADDQVWVEQNANGVLVVSPPEAIAGKFEVRGLGIIEMPFLAEARLVLVCDLVAPEQVPRMPEPLDRMTLAGATVASLKLAAFEASAPLKLRMALLQASNQSGSGSTFGLAPASTPDKDSAL
jgi:HPr kinase/phosphorylase